MTFLTRLEATLKLWDFAIPAIEKPANSVWCHWLSIYTDEEVEKTITQVPWRYKNKPAVSAIEVHKFMSATLCQMRNRRLNPKRSGKPYVKPSTSLQEQEKKKTA